MKVLLAAAMLAAMSWLAVARADEAPKVITMDVVDQPGRVSGEETTIDDGPYKRQVVFYRTTAAPGTIIINTDERFLYLVPGTIAPSATASASAATGSSGRACSRSRASRNGPIGARRQR